MRVVADLPSAAILQVEKDPDIGIAAPFNGRFSVPIPGGASVAVNNTSYVLPVNGGDVWSQAMVALLAQYPMYEYVVFNPLLAAADLVDIDLAATGPAGEETRLQMGRAIGPSPGNAPNMVALLGENPYTGGPNKPGCLVTDTIDISTILPPGADEFLVWWKFYEFSTTEDVESDFGGTIGQNDPAYKNIVETDQEPSGLTVYITNDDGATWYVVDRDTPVDVFVLDTRVRLAFVSTEPDRLYLAGYAILF